MDRREFVKRLVPVTTLPFCLDSVRLTAFGRSPALEATVAATRALDRVLVLIQLNGGNDGINTVIPLDQYSTYSNVRKSLAVPESSVLRITDAAGFHPAAGGLQTLYDSGKLCVVQGVSYPNPNFSHFRATDIWLTASDYNQYLSSGWIGRYLDWEFPGYPADYPNDVMPDPLAIQIGSVVSFGFQGPEQSMAVALKDPNTFYNLVSGTIRETEEEAPKTTAGQELSFIRQVATQSISYASRIKTAADRAVNKSNLYPSAGRNTLADQLKIVARLIAGGLKTRLYLVSMGGFDNHSSQVSATDATTGAHAILLGNLATAALAFQDDLELLGMDHRVIAMTFSEFGRRVTSNASLGTDHGTAAPVFLFGRQVRAGIIGANPSLTDLTGGNLKMQHDYRSVYASVLTQWFDAAPEELGAVLLKDFTTLDLVVSGSLLGRRRPFEVSH